MKRVFFAALLASAVGMPAIAASPFEIREIGFYANGQDISDLTDQEVNHLIAIIHGDDRDNRIYQRVHNFLVHRSGESFLGRLFK